MSKKNKANKSKPGVAPGAHAKMLLSAVRGGGPIRRGPPPPEMSYLDMLGLLRDLGQEPMEYIAGLFTNEPVNEHLPSPYDLAPWQAAILKRTMEQTKPRDEFHRRAQKAEGASKYLWKSMRRYQDMLEKAYYLIGMEIGRGNRFVVDPVPLIKDAPLMNAFKNALHRGYRDGENLSPELRILDHDRITLTPAGEGN